LPQKQHTFLVKVETMIKIVAHPVSSTHKYNLKRNTSAETATNQNAYHSQIYSKRQSTET